MIQRIPIKFLTKLAIFKPNLREFKSAGQTKEIGHAGLIPGIKISGQKDWSTEVFEFLKNLIHLPFEGPGRLKINSVNGYHHKIHGPAPDRIPGKSDGFGCVSDGLLVHGVLHKGMDGLVGSPHHRSSRSVLFSLIKKADPEIPIRPDLSNQTFKTIIPVDFLEQEKLLTAGIEFKLIRKLIQRSLLNIPNQGLNRIRA